MIENVKIHNYRALRGVNVSLAPLTVLIGPNNSGKTSFLQAIADAATLLGTFAAAGLLVPSFEVVGAASAVLIGTGLGASVRAVTLFAELKRAGGVQ